MWDLRGLGRVGAHAASTGNPDANHEWMGVLLILGDRERPSARMVQACQDFFYDVFLARWPGRTRDTGHGRAPGVPGAQTSCPGPFAAELIVDGVLTDQPEGDDMPTTREIWYDDMIEAPPGYDTSKNPTWSAASVIRSAQLYARLADEKADRAGDKLDALLAAQEGLDTAAVLERIDQRHAEAAQQRDAIAITMTGKLDAVVAATQGSDPAEAKLAAILEILGVDA